MIRVGKRYGTGTKIEMAHRHHSVKDIDAKLRQADEMVANGNTQKDISQALGISVMTYHRWRRSRDDHRSEDRAPTSSENDVVRDDSPTYQVSALEIENERLRRLVTDLLLEKIALQEQMQGREPSARRRGN
jgi:hypothetical protein